MECSRKLEMWASLSPKMPTLHGISSKGLQGPRDGSVGAVERLDALGALEERAHARAPRGGLGLVETAHHVTTHGAEAHACAWNERRGER